MKHCNNCSKCCELIMLDGVSPADVEDKHRRGAIDKIYVEILAPISRAEALQKNEAAVLEREKHNLSMTSARGLPPREVFFYSCPKLVNGRCSEYDRRPSMCSTYPFRPNEASLSEDYNSHAWLSKRQYVINEPRYSNNCSYLPGMIPVVNL